MWCAWVFHAQANLNYFTSANSGSTTKSLEPGFLSSILAVSMVFLFPPGKSTT